MSRRIAAKITGVAGYLPPRVMRNADLEKLVDTNDEWIRTRTGIRERHYAEPGVASSHLGAEAAKKLMAATGLRAGRDRIDRGGHGDPGHAVPGDGMPDSGPVGSQEGVGIRPLRRVLGISLRVDGGRAVRWRRNAQEGAGDRQRCDDFHFGFQGSRHLRAIRRRRGRGAGGGGGISVGGHSGFRARHRRLGRIATYICRAAARCIRHRPRRSRSACTTCIRRARWYSSTRYGE